MQCALHKTVKSQDILYRLFSFLASASSCYIILIDFCSMKNLSKSPYLNLPSNNSNVSYSLAIREAITKLSLSPAETIKYLNNENSIWSNNHDDATQYALNVLKKFYQQLRNEVKTKSSFDSEGLIKFLAKHDENRTKDVITRICGKQQRLPKRKTWTHLKIADPDTPRDIRPVPSNVPRLDVNEFDSDSSNNAKESNEDEDDTSESSSEIYREPFNEKIASPGKIESNKFSTPSSSSSLSSSTISSSLNPNEKTLKETQKLAKNVFKIVHKVDKAISPRSQPSSRMSELNSIPLSDEKVTSRYIPQSSKAIQTDFEIPVRPKTVDAAVSARLLQTEVDTKSNSSATTSLHQLIDKSSGETTTATSSSLFSSSLSAGEIPLYKVAQMTARSKYTVVSIRPDGSCSSAIANYQAFKETSKFYPSTPKTPTLIESRDELTSYHNSSFANLPPLKTSTPINKGTTTFGVNKSSLPRGPIGTQSHKESDGDGSSLRVHEHSLPTTSLQQKNYPQVEELTPKEIREHLIRRHLDAEPVSVRSETEEESTLNQVSPLPSGE